ncbi:hypothetical protein MPTK1_4g11340 [Marchantia polymorpha subsp. ruderalis]|uniref:Uncharacterized protein n=2 Tax=Marchantia polymorpha TaxID=3197 RepID=A0AAF6B8S2_MARPO|nr:hypothetical protein MARPO_0011s0119 [Marchantia polymorpha]BBN08406.1 hypothetical protein Mp_4g11340 [Marchantia polymorpha subsp. ruderalis]|eukprot:PTQ46442.1 hypothetical protein MARPO_0011s0119 [Marchantia polymorpha]
MPNIHTLKRRLYERLTVTLMSGEQVQLPERWSCQDPQLGIWTSAICQLWATTKATRLDFRECKNWMTARTNRALAKLQTEIYEVHNIHSWKCKCSHYFSISTNYLSPSIQSFF